MQARYEDTCSTVQFSSVTVTYFIRASPIMDDDDETLKIIYN